MALLLVRAAIARAVLAAVASVAGRATAVAVVDRGEDGGLHCVEEVGVEVSWYVE